MPLLMENQPIGWATNLFSERVKRGESATCTADTIVTAWEGIDSVMRLIIGKHCMNGLFSRSIEGTKISYPWLAALSQDGQSEVDLKALRALLLKQDAVGLAAASDALLFYLLNMLVELIGLTLTERLLRPVLDPLLTVAVIKDTSLCVQK